MLILKLYTYIMREYLVWFLINLLLNFIINYIFIHTHTTYVYVRVYVYLDSLLLFTLYVAGCHISVVMNCTGVGAQITYSVYAFLNLLNLIFTLLLRIFPIFFNY